VNALVDLDGVLVDSVTEMFRRFGQGKTPAVCQGSYNTSTILGIDDPWSQFGGDFFEYAAWTFDGRDLLDVVESICPVKDIFVCTTPTYESSSAEGKLRWVRANLPQYERQYVLTPYKELLAAEDSVLIDDCDENVDRFIDAGGYAILVPRAWNRLYKFNGSVVQYVRDQLLAVKAQIEGAK
jgi:hypothetical protein